jgi:hypothetical protein
MNNTQLQELFELGFISDAELARRLRHGDELTLDDFNATSMTPSVCTCEDPCGAPSQCLQCGADVLACGKARHRRVCAGDWTSVKFACPNAWQGCAAMVTRATFAEHLDECDFGHVLCKCVDESGPGPCLQSVRRGALAAHMASQHGKQTSSFCRQVAFCGEHESRTNNVDSSSAS